jgi:hypothetical protein
LYKTSVRYSGGNLIVELGSDSKNGADVRIFDLQGRIVMRHFVKKSEVLDVRQLPPGLYHVVVRSDKRTVIQLFKK